MSLVIAKGQLHRAIGIQHHDRIVGHTVVISVKHDDPVVGRVVDARFALARTAVGQREVDSGVGLLELNVVKQPTESTVADPVERVDRCTLRWSLNDYGLEAFNECKLLEVEL